MSKEKKVSNDDGEKRREDKVTCNGVVISAIVGVNCVCASPLSMGSEPKLLCTGNTI
jgi:hypothetical protein